MMTNRQSPFAAQCPPEHLDRIIHARLELDGGAFLYAGDCPASMPYQGRHGVSLALNYYSVEKAKEVFDALAEGGTVMMPMNEAFWAKRFGMVTDRFGCHWLVNGEMIHVDLAG
ncbi:MAG TPA: VOC family protein, partial [Candidatus Saccharimonadales bacterium]|nr:VOC family protein [Candidatus Saccharimonadales bacterium]